MTIDRVQSQSPEIFVLRSAEQLALDLGGDPSARIAAMALIASKETRDATQEARAREEQHLQAQEVAQVRAMHAQADALRRASTIEGISQVAGGGLQIAAATLDQCETAKALGGATEVLGGMGKVGSAQERFVASVHEANSVRSGQLAEASARRFRDLESSLDQARDLRNAAVDFLRTATRIEHESDQASIIRG